MRYAARVDANHVELTKNKGENNPNWKNAGWHNCDNCNKQFHSYIKTRKFCSHECYVKKHKDRIVLQALLAAKLPRKPRARTGIKCVCKHCKLNFVSMTHRQMYCENHKAEAKKAQGSGAKKLADPLKKTTSSCMHCGNTFSFYKSHPKKFCSYQCHLDSGGAWRAGIASKEKILKYGAKKDANHNEIVDVLKKAGASIVDLSHVGCGMPDLICGFRNKTVLIEIKNTKTAYGRRGFNKNQLKWQEQWLGGPVALVDSAEAALRVLKLMESS